MDVTAATAEVKARGFDYLSDPRVLIALNNAKNAFEDVYPWPWLETTTTGPSPLTIADVRAVLYVVDTTNQGELQGIDSRSVVDADPIVTTAGPPSYWWLDGATTLKTYPTQTTASLSVRYVKFSPELVNAGDTPLIPVRYHPVWIDLAVIEAAKDDEDFGDVQQLVADTQRRLAQIVENYASMNRQNPMLQTVTGTSEDW